jgi:hypothetical protein
MSTELSTLNKTYGDEDFDRFYAVSRYLIQVGQLHTAEVILKGLTAVRPDKALGWLGRCYLHAFQAEFEELLDAARQGLKAEPRDVGLRIFLIIGLFALGDIAAAGTELGEVGELLELSPPEDAAVYRLYKSQLARYQNQR